MLTFPGGLDISGRRGYSGIELGGKHAKPLKNAFCVFFCAEVYPFGGDALGFHTVDGRTPASPKKPWKDASPT